VAALVVFALPLPVPLAYAVPPHLEGLVRRGVRVRAPLRGRPRVGLVIGQTEDGARDGEDLVPIAEVLDVEPILPAHILDLVEFAADYYAAPLGTVTRAALPAGLLSLPPTLVEVGPRALEILAGASPEARRLLERVVAARRVSLARLRAEGWPAAQLDGLLADLAARRAVKVVERRLGAPGTRLAGALALVEPPPEGAPAPRGPAQRRVMDWLERQGRPVLEAEVLAACQCSRSVVSALVSAGFLRRFQQERPRQVQRWEMRGALPPLELSRHQSAALAEVEAALGRGEYAAFLLFGVTGSGKTEVYLRLAATARERGLQTLVLVPEIALTPALAGHLAARFQGRTAVLHSAMPEGERAAVWDRVRRGEVDVVAGPRSALWVPLARLGLVVVDEEHDASYKQGEEPRYNARDLALVLGRIRGIPVVLASATPSMEALRLVETRRASRLDLPERVGSGALPEVEVVDLAGERPEAGEHGRVIFSRRLAELLRQTLGEGRQAILLVNRRGWAPVLLCRMCGRHVACPSCSIPMTVHRRQQSLLCHYCDHRAPIPSRCPSCGGEVLDDVGVGTEKVAAAVARLLPAARVGILDRDTARSSVQLLATLEAFATGAMDVLVGTQMVSKGHHFPGVTLTGVVNADNLLGFPDFRGAERTFQLLTQVAGRAGRGASPGRVVFQTYHPDHHAVRCAARHDAVTFAEAELAYRRAFRYPPFSRLALVRFESVEERTAREAAEEAARLADRVSGLRVVGPALAPISRLRGRFRVQLLLFAPHRGPIREALAGIAAVRLPRTVHRVVDVDPQSTV